MVLAVVVLLGAVAVLVVVLLLQPRAPYVAVRAASLYALVYGQTRALDDVQVTVRVEARNGNAHSAAYFSRLECRLAFVGATLAVLRAYPFHVPARGVLPLAYMACAQGAPLGDAGSAAMEAALRDGMVPFRVEGEARTRWKAGDRGEHEVAFYEAFSAHAAVPTRIRDTFFPRFHGTRLLPTEAQPGEPHPHLVLDDLLAGFEVPCVADIKIGAITWPPSSPEPYIAKCLAKDRGTTSVLLGFRVSGVRVVGPEGAVWRTERPEVKAMDTVGVRRVLRRYVSSVADEGIDCALAAAVYGGKGGVLSQLRELKAWFEEQTLFHFYLDLI
ncbi:Inositol polyphosphate multikinase beta [Zea mays]|uniref:Inositol polyphosphate multikinase n=1 Tax=Zea mays TaxID=4577 RepID=A0A1D6E561_MAIZE|nr:Inositol polyphosphate multikinase beta [Zea mays]